MRESEFQSRLIRELKVRYPGCIVMKNDANYIQGIPDLTILHGDRWATLECKRSEGASVRPNQLYYVDEMNAMSFSSFISPDNYDEVLGMLDSHFGRVAL